MSNNSHEAALASDWLIFFQISVWPEPRKYGGRKKGPPSLNQVRGTFRTGTLSASGPCVPEVETAPTQSELERRVEEVEKLGEVGR